MPNEPDIESLLGMLQGQASQSPMQQFSPLGQFGAGLAGLGAGMQGQPNPVLGQAQSQQDTQFRQRLEMIKLQQSVQKQREGQKKLELDLYRDLVGSPFPEARKMGAQGIAEHLKGTGQQVSPEFVESFAAGSLSLDQRKQAYISVLAAEQDPGLGAGIDTYLEKSLNIPKPMIPSLKAEAKSEAVHKLLYGKTLGQEQLDMAKADRDERRVVSQEARQDLLELREQRVGRQSEERLGIAQRGADRADAQLALSEARFEWAKAKGPEEKRLKGLDQADLLANQMSTYAHQLNELHYLPPPGASILDPAYLQARSNRVLYPNEPAWQTWVRHLQPAMIGYARSVQNDIGPRAMAAFQGALKLMENPPDIKSIETVVDNMRKAIKLGREGKDTAQNVLIKRPNGQVLRVPWKRGMDYAPGDLVVGIE